MNLSPIAFRAAQLYYGRDLRQEEVAKELGVSRASVALYLQKAREAGFVEIRLRSEMFAHHELAQEIKTRFEIENAYVAEMDHPKKGGEEDAISLGAQVLLDKLVDGDRLGVAWGRTVQRLSEVLPLSPRKGVTVVQLCGNLGSPFGHSPEECVFAIAKQLTAVNRNLYAPLVVSTPDLAQQIRNEPIIAKQFQEFSQCNKAVFSIGDCHNDSHLVQCGAVTKDEMSDYVHEGARGVIAGRLVGAAGAPMAYRGGDRVLGISLEELREIPFRLAVTTGREKASAVLAGLKGGFATHVVLDRALAEQVLIENEKKDVDGN